MGRSKKTKSAPSLPRSRFSDDEGDDYRDERLGASDGMEEDDIIMQHVRSQQELLTRQDESLSLLGEGAARLGELSLSISQELKTQNKMLDEMGNDIERTEDNVMFVTKKTKELIKLSGGNQTFGIIVCLSIVLAILIFLVIYT